ncbi:DUF3726 domain-containing protein [Aliiroseovarius lamellibrachiae]|uniref:DUF3726 domain-containing protein n=1 Tax=Aliiroseovarius lamellibrachiae TaxID=1924933 RepID=UPI001BE019FB|nr:DUF3726 domain-containing protein [Aliiroseovarius lamellibrachiae]MBT2130588.1 DUF3726 domain-containing protein [Aliiroseovarius lamellibrachiae]
MSHSLNEIEAMSKRAARGAGLSWGLAEEAAKGTRWLSSFGFSGPELLADLLELNDRLPPVDFSPVSLRADVWHAPARRMSPLLAGAALSDCAVRLLERGTITMENVSLPMLAVPFMGGAALRLGVPVAVEWEGVRLATDGKQLSVQGDATALRSAQADRVVFIAPAEMAGRREPVMRADVSDESWERLGVFAHRTYAPATEESRLRGAGAGLSDND